ncbi:MAG: anion permease, partial [Parachlamydiaceae bacterium]
SKMIKITPQDPSFILVILSGLIGAIIWNLITWALALPTSSSHALIGGLSGAAMAFGGIDTLQYDLLLITALFIFISPFLGFIGGFLIMFLNFALFRKSHPQEIDQLFRKGQLVSAALYSIGHGANDAQKTMGVIFACLLAAGYVTEKETLSLTNPNTSWIIFSCHLAMAIGTALGGWRIIKTLGQRITPLKPIGGFSAETSGAIALFFATATGIPVSTTHTITASIIGVGMVNTPLSRIKWTIARKIVWAWIFTLPCAAIMAAMSLLVLKTIQT